MKLSRRKLLNWAAGAAVLPIASRRAPAQSYPARPVRIIVPYAPGGPPDVFGRLMAQKLSDRFGKQFYVENIPGAGGNIGTGQAAKAPPDGYTILLAVNSLIINPALYATVPYDPDNDFDPVTLAVTFSTGLHINPSVSATAVNELVALISTNPGKFSYASAGVGTPSHLMGELFRMSHSLDLPHIPFTGSNPALASVVSGHVPIAFAALTAAVPHIRGGRLRTLVIMSPRRSSTLADVPTAAEAGYPELDGDSWIGVLVPAGTPKEIVNLLNLAVKQIVGQPEVQQQMVPLGLDAVGTSPEEFSAQLRTEMEKWGKVIRAANIKAK